jgi:hypothetical protein
MVKRKTVPKAFVLGNARLLPTAEWPEVDSVGRVSAERPKAIGYTEGLLLSTASGQYLGFIEMGLRPGDRLTTEFVFWRPGSSGSAMVTASLLQLLDHVFLGEPVGSTTEQYEALGDFIQRWHADRSAP